jgi:hypothetical protein
MKQMRNRFLEITEAISRSAIVFHRCNKNNTGASFKSPIAPIGD